MEQSSEQNILIPPENNPVICPFCHQPVLPTYFFCPNCGTKLNSGPLSTSFTTQVGLYVFSIILPMILFLYINRWTGARYIKSKDFKTKLIGFIALTLLILSTSAVIWLGWVTWVSFSDSLVYYQKFIDDTVKNMTTSLY